MTIKLRTVLIAVIVALAMAAGGGFAAYRHFNSDLTGMTAEEIAQYKIDNPKVNVRYTVTIEGGEAPLVLTHDTTRIELTTPAQAEDLATKSGYFPLLETIDLGSTHVTSDQIFTLSKSFLGVKIEYQYLNVLGEAVPADTELLDWSDLALADLDQALADIHALGNLRTIELRAADGMPNLSLEDALKIHEAYPNLHIGYALELFGQTVSTDMEALEYVRVYIGDKGVDEIRKVLPLMDKLSYLKLDACETTNDTMAQLRADFPNIEIHWRVYLGKYNVMTDNYKLWAGGLIDDQAKALHHLRGIRYMDIGHHNLTNLDFCANLPELNTLIVAIGPLNDISGLKNCTKLEYLELMVNAPLDDEDMENLAGLVNLEHLNIGALPNITNLSFTDNMTKLKRLHCTMSNIPQEEIDRFIALHPDCEVNFSRSTDPIEDGWRYNPGGVGTHDARYLLLREQMGYLLGDISQWPLGELKEEITYESTGIIPE